MFTCSMYLLAIFAFLAMIRLLDGDSEQILPSFRFIAVISCWFLICIAALRCFIVFRCVFRLCPIGIPQCVYRLCFVAIPQCASWLCSIAVPRIIFFLFSVACRSFHGRVNNSEEFSTNFTWNLFKVKLKFNQLFLSRLWHTGNHWLQPKWAK